jgi:hypothetical protein
VAAKVFRARHRKLPTQTTTQYGVLALPALLLDLSDAKRQDAAQHALYEVRKARTHEERKI